MENKDQRYTILEARLDMGCSAIEEEDITLPVF
jgi:hypothetical protein